MASKRILYKGRSGTSDYDVPQPDQAGTKAKVAWKKLRIGPSAIVSVKPIDEYILTQMPILKKGKPASKRGLAKIAQLFEP